MAKVRSKSKIVKFTVIVSTKEKFDLKDHLTGVSIDLEDDDLDFEVKSLKCLEVKDNFIVLFGYTVLGLDYCSKSIKWTLMMALTEQRGEATPAPEMEVILN